MTKAGDGNVWVLTRGTRIWDEGSYEGGGGERITYPDPIAGPTVLHLEADTGKVRRTAMQGLALDHANN